MAHCNTVFFVFFALSVLAHAEMMLVTREFQETFSDSDIKNWQVVNAAKSDHTTTCGSLSLFGGFEVFGS